MEPVHHSEILHTLIALATVNLASVTGSISFALGRRLNAAIPYLVSAAAGALLGTALTHLLPEAIQRVGSGQKLGVLLVIGFLFSFLLERLLSTFFHAGHDHGTATLSLDEAQFHHVHEYDRKSGKALAANILFGGGVHSFIDGIAVATGFAVGHNVGLATTIAVLIHEVPHHVADVGVLIYTGMTKRRAVLLNLIATMGSSTGGLLVLAFGLGFQSFTAILVPFTAANFLYIGLAVLMPELQKERSGWRSVAQAFCLLGTTALMFALAQLASD